MLREIAAVYRDRIKSDTALVTVLTQIVQLDGQDIESLRELTRVYETLGRWRDLLQHQTALADLLPSGDEKAELFRAVARRWLDQFSNVQNAIEAYEALLEAAPGDEEAVSKLKELYVKRRAWGPALRDSTRSRPRRRKAPAARAARRDGQARGREARSRAPRRSRLQSRSSSEDPQRAGVLDALEKQAEREKDFATVAEVARAPHRRRRRTTPRASPSLQKLGAVYAERLTDPGGAAARPGGACSTLSPGHAKALRVLRESYFARQRLGRARGALRLAERLGGARRLPLLGGRQGDRGAGQARSLVPRGAHLRASSSGRPSARSVVRARALGAPRRRARPRRRWSPIYEKEEKWARLPALYEVLLTSAEDDDPKLDLLHRLVEVTGQRLGERAVGGGMGTQGL